MFPCGSFRGRRSECGNRVSDASFLLVFHSNRVSILLSFRVMTMGQTTDYRLMMAAITHLALKVVSSNRECHDDAVSLQYPSSCLSTLFVVAMMLLLKDPEPDVRIRAAEAISHLLNIWYMYSSPSQIQHQQQQQLLVVGVWYHFVVVATACLLTKIMCEIRDVRSSAYYIRLV